MNKTEYIIIMRSGKRQLVSALIREKMKRKFEYKICTKIIERELIERKLFAMRLLSNWYNDGVWEFEKCTDGYYAFWRSGMAGMSYSLFPEVQKKDLNRRNRYE